MKILDPINPNLISKDQDQAIRDMQGFTVGEVLDYARNQ